MKSGLQRLGVLLQMKQFRALVLDCDVSGDLHEDHGELSVDDLVALLFRHGGRGSALGFAFELPRMSSQIDVRRAV